MNIATAFIASAVMPSGPGEHVLRIEFMMERISSSVVGDKNIEFLHGETKKESTDFTAKGRLYDVELPAFTK